MRHSYYHRTFDIVGFVGDGFIVCEKCGRASDPPIVLAWNDGMAPDLADGYTPYYYGDAREYFHASSLSEGLCVNSCDACLDPIGVDEDEVAETRLRLTREESLRDYRAEMTSLVAQAMAVAFTGSTSDILRAIDRCQGHIDRLVKQLDGDDEEDD